MLFRRTAKATTEKEDPWKILSLLLLFYFCFFTFLGPHSRRYSKSKKRGRGRMRQRRKRRRKTFLLTGKGGEGACLHCNNKGPPSLPCSAVILPAFKRRVTRFQFACSVNQWFVCRKTSMVIFGNTCGYKKNSERKREMQAWWTEKWWTEKRELRRWLKWLHGFGKDHQFHRRIECYGGRVLDIKRVPLKKGPGKLKRKRNWI